MRKIVFVSAYSYPELVSSEYLSTDVMTQASFAGLDVLHISPNQIHGLSKKQIQYYKTTSVEKKQYGKHITLRALSIFERKFIFRYFRYLSFGGKVIRFLKYEKDVCSIFLWSYPPLGFSKRIVKYARKHGISVVFDVHDIHPDILKSIGIIKKIIKKNVDYVLHNSTYVFTLSDDMRDSLVFRGVSKEKISVIYPWTYEIDHMPSIPLELVNLFNNNYVISYIGNIGLFQNIPLLLDVAKEMQQYNNIKFLFVGNGALQHIVVEASKQHTNIVYHEKISKEEAAFLYKSSNINIISLNNNVIKYACPSKTPMILQAGKPILLIADDSKYSDELTSLGAFRPIKNNIAEIVKTILKIKGTPNSQCSMSKNYSRKESLSKWKEFFETKIQKR